jgi:hypothetical protein
MNMKRIQTHQAGRRKAGVESLESRQLLAGDLGSVPPESDPDITDVATLVSSDPTAPLSIATPVVAHNSLDVNRDETITSLDALMVINFLNSQSTFEGEFSRDPNNPDSNSDQLDVNRDGWVSAVDALMIINAMNQAEANNLRGGCSCGGIGCVACSTAFPIFNPTYNEISLIDETNEDVT